MVEMHSAKILGTNSLDKKLRAGLIYSAAGFRNYYVVVPPRGSILLETSRVVGVCLAARCSWNPFATWRNIRRPGFWDPAKPSTYKGGEVPGNITWDDESVGEVHRTMVACKVFLFFPIYWLCYSQIDGNLGTVAAGMTLHGSPNDLDKNLDPIAIVALIPVFERVIYPSLRKVGINFSPISGLPPASLSPLQPSACTTADGKPNAAPLNFWIVAGPCILVAISEIFASITSLTRMVVMKMSKSVFPVSLRFARTALIFVILLDAFVVRETYI
ncbi:hypothetical protein FB451DRAFT_1477669 [Mycena latifolia]|nr:hypothetical protein FB451DRAFT_1477669 [Mycena latifolia]